MAQLLQKMINGDNGARAGEPALTDRHGVTSWGELNQRVNQLVHLLRSLGVQPGERVALLSGNRREVYEIIQAAAHSGILLVPINWHFAAEEVQYVVDNSGSRAIFVDPTYGAAADGIDLPRFDFADHEHGGNSSYETALAGQSADEPEAQEMGGVMFYTSGTTGRPKGVRNTAFGTGGGVPPEVYELMAAGMVNIGFPPNGRTLLCGPHYHSAQWAFTFFPMVGGSSVVLQEKFVPEETLRLIDEHAITNIHLVPTQFVRLLRADEAAKAAFSGESLQLVLHGAAPCSPQVKRQMIEWWGPKVTEYYGATEGGVVSLITAEEWLRKPGSVGKPMANYIVRIQPEDDEGGATADAAAPFEPGTIHIRNMMGTDFEYLGEPEKTKDAHRLEGMFTLGDIGYLDDEGYLFLSDRKIDMIISGGVNIYPAEIEGVLTAHPSVVDAAVFGIPDEEFGEQVKAALQLAPGAVWDSATEASVVAHAREHLAGYKVPRSFDLVEAMPRSEAGKLLKRELRTPYWEGIGRSI
ncbi:MAG TPA: AMP-dependent synthetase [Acidimicrobiaceae bacterium]|nr:AMP-dependent synthetase [Acidimicrobiaceae bacterium]